MGERGGNSGAERGGGEVEVGQNRARPTYHQQNTKDDLYLGCLTKNQLIIGSVVVGVIILLIIIIVPAVVLTQNKKSDPPAPAPAFPPEGDMLDFLVQSGDISKHDGLLASWYHRANDKDQMNAALASDSMILEADVTLRGYGTPAQENIPIMAHPPAVYSNNTLDEWLDAVLASRKGIKLDFKALAAVDVSLQLLIQKNTSRGINRPLWLNADIIRGPNVPALTPVINGTAFLQLIQQRFPDVTISPGWMVLYSPLLPGTYTKKMVDDMFALIKELPQRVTFPIHALLVRTGWQHISWLLSQSPRYTLTLWQGDDHPTLNDLLFVRDNTHPARVYYDIYEPTLSAFREAARQQDRVRRFYPGGDLMDFFNPPHYSDSDTLSTVPQRNSLAVRWVTVNDRTSLLARLSDGAGGMLVLRVVPDTSRPGVPVLEGSGKSSAAIKLEEVLQLLGQQPHAPWGVHLRVHTQQLLEASLTLLQSAHSREELYRPVWISMEDPHSTKEFVSTVERLFPFVTLVMNGESWSTLGSAEITHLSQRVAVHLKASWLPKGEGELELLAGRMDKHDVLVEDAESSAEAITAFKEYASRRAGRAKANLFVMSGQF